MSLFNLLLPETGATISAPLTGTLSWGSLPNRDSYILKVALDKSLSNLIIDTTVVGTTYRLALCPETEYWWQVYEGGGAFESQNGPFSFRTPAPVIREDAPAAERFAPARPGSIFAVPFAPYITEPLPEDPTVPISPWFYKKSYDEGPLRKFDEVKRSLPRPVLEGEQNVSLLETYWYTWKLAFEWTLYEPEEKGQAVSPIMGIRDWGKFGSSVDMDCGFDMLFLRYAHGTYPFVKALDNFYARQHENGLINKEGNNSNYEVYSSSPTMPSLLAWAEWENYLISGDADRLRKVFLPLIKFYEWFQRYQRRANGHYYCEQAGHGDWDISADGFQALYAQSLSYMAEVTGRADLAEYFQQEHRTLFELVNSSYWDETHRIYNSRLQDGRFATELQPGKLFKYVRSYELVMAGLATRERAQAMIKQLLDPAVFMGKYGIRSLSKDSSMYIIDSKRMTFEETAGEETIGFNFKKTVWPPNMVSALRTLDLYGYDDEAADLGERYAKALAEIYREHGDVYEYSLDEELKACGHKRFTGWSGYGPIACLIEYVLGFKVDAVNNKLHWHIHRQERHGIEGLYIGDNCTSLICDERRSTGGTLRITVDASKAFTLKVSSKSGVKEYRLDAGRTTIEH